MSKKHVYAKSEHGIGDFVYVDLLPEVRRPRQFNVNVIIALLFTVVLIWVLVFQPVTLRTQQLEDLNSWNNDLHHELRLTNEEFLGYEIDLDVIEFEEQIEGLDGLRVDFNNLLDDVELEVDKVDGQITFISYSAENSELRVTVRIGSFYSFSELEHTLLNLPWVVSSNPIVPEKNGVELQYSATFILEVNPDVE